ncbi:MAG: thioredoxin [Thermoleophilia bacterium]|nr:thioredoxin [Thermoleophilia bacterium]
MGTVGHVSDANFAVEVEGAATPVLVDFWAEWCGPCRQMNPVLAEYAAEYDGKVKVVKLNVDDNPETAKRFQVLSIPTMLLFKDGDAVKSLVGAMPKGRLESALNDWVPAQA